MTDVTTPLPQTPPQTNEPEPPVGKALYWPVELCSKEYFDRVAGAAWTAFIAARSTSLPSVEIIVKYMGRAAGKPKAALVAKVIGTEEFKKAMADRGITWSSKTLGITPEQSFALAIITDPTAGTFATKLKKAGITHAKWNAWLKQDLFRAAFESITEGSLSDNIGNVHTALVNKAVNGDVRAMEFYYQISGRFDPQREVNINMQAILLKILEVLTMRISDPQLLRQIGEDLEAIVTDGGIPQAIGPGSNTDIEDAVEVPAHTPRPVEFEMPRNHQSSVFNFGG